MEWKIPLFKMYSDEREIIAVSKIIKRGTFWADGQEIREFEQKVEDYLGTKNVVSFNSGTSALHILLAAYNIKNKEVIVPSFTFISTINAIPMAKGIPIFTEIEEETYGLDIKDVEKKITPNTKAIILVHYGGQPARDTEKITALAKEKDILLIEDAAESFGASINGKPVGTFGDGAIFSLCQSKIITTGEGGIALTNSKKVYEKMKLMRSHGRLETTDGDYFSNTEENDYIILGHSLRLPTISAALGIAQLEKIKEIKKMRIKNAEYYTKELSKIKEVSTPKQKKGFEHLYQMYTIKLKDKKTRDALQDHLKNKKILSKVFFPPSHLKTYYTKKHGFKKGYLQKTEEISEKVLTIPMFPHITKKELDYTINSIREFFK
ncbi:DegT/DnrJ/EryC1/StrS family aminotransferase [archaeon]|nr:DegT/DnrJ/EryC1/StrS family aminotransferase [archaeon]